MGYQLVDVERREGQRQAGVAYNAELVLLEHEPRADLRVLTFERLVKAANSSEGEITSIRLRESTTQRSAVLEKAVKETKSTEAKNAPVQSTSRDEVFKRFSAYQNDRRVQSDGSLLAGTYATTEADARLAPTGSAAVKRYALPNPAPASWLFTSKPNAGTAIQRGIVASANGQPGGGVEVIFTNGTSAGTTTGPERIPD